MDDKKNSSVSSDYKKGITPESIRITNNGTDYNANSTNTRISDGTTIVTESIATRNNNNLRALDEGTVSVSYSLNVDKSDDD